MRATRLRFRLPLAVVALAPGEDDEEEEEEEAREEGCGDVDAGDDCSSAGVDSLSTKPLQLLLLLALVLLAVVLAKGPRTPLLLVLLFRLSSSSHKGVRGNVNVPCLLLQSSSCQDEEAGACS